MFVLETGKIKCMDGLTVPSGEVVEQIVKHIIKYLEILEIDEAMEK